MRIAALADIHGNLPALEAVLGELQSEPVDLIIVAGDLTGGPQGNQVIETLRQLDAFLIIGNSDINLLRYAHGEAPDAWLFRKQFGLLRWNARVISSENLQFLSGLPQQGTLAIPPLDPIRVVHGTLDDPFEPIYPDQDLAVLDRSLELIHEPVLVCGHTHEPWIRRRNGKLALNPGSVAGPLNGQIGAQYARLLWEEEAWSAELFMVSYDLWPVREAFVSSGLLEEGGAVARSFLLSMETGRDVTLMFLEHAFELARQAGCDGADILPDEIWDRATKTFAWDSI